jgi:HD-GYP domain-containing protein (c-di-GMP phosphodiesterase class II)
MTPAMDAAAGRAVRMSDVISALSYALDITEGQPEGHALRTCLIGMRIADELRLPAADRSALFYALLLKDAGCSSNAAKVCSLFQCDDQRLKRTMKTSDWTRFSENVLWALRHVAADRSAVARAAALLRLGLQQRQADELFETRCERGAEIARALLLPPATAEAIRTLDEHWDGNGRPARLRGHEIPLLGRILCVAQTIDVFVETHGLEGAYEVVRERRGTWFDPALVDALESIRPDTAFWARLAVGDLEAGVAAVEPEEIVLRADEDGLDRIAAAFARVIDAKSPYTASHSEGVAEIATGIGAMLSMDADELRLLRRAGLLHDIGKLGVSNRILDKPGSLTDDERAEMAFHPGFTYEILLRVEAFRRFAADAAAHHERLDGSGYPRGLSGLELTLPARILAVADVYEALTAPRPYRGPMAPERAFAILAEEAGRRLDESCVEALRVWASPALAA